MKDKDGNIYISTTKKTLFFFVNFCAILRKGNYVSILRQKPRFKIFSSHKEKC